MGLSPRNLISLYFSNLGGPPDLGDVRFSSHPWPRIAFYFEVFFHFSHLHLVFLFNRRDSPVALCGFFPKRHLSGVFVFLGAWFRSFVVTVLLSNFQFVGVFLFFSHRGLLFQDLCRHYPVSTLFLLTHGTRSIRLVPAVRVILLHIQKEPDRGGFR